MNASGPWVDELDSLDNKTHGNKLQLTKGVHLVVDHQKLPIKQSVYFDTYDKRMMFVIPRDGKTYLGTTDTFYKEDKLNPLTTEEDRIYLLKCVNDYFSCSLKLSDIESSWAGIRPLIKTAGKNPSEISRKDEIFEWESGLITIAGGKLTGYRKMAQRIVDLLAKKIAVAEQKKLPACSTHQILLSGGKIDSESFSEFVKDKMRAGIALGLSPREAETLAHRYGSETDKLHTILNTLIKNEDATNRLPLSLRAELIYVIENEMCLTPTDFFIRRTGMLYFDMDSAKKHSADLISYMQQILKWDKTLAQRYTEELQEAVLNAQ